MQPLQQALLSAVLIHNPAAGQRCCAYRPLSQSNTHNKLSTAHTTHRLSWCINGWVTVTSRIRQQLPTATVAETASTERPADAANDVRWHGVWKLRSRVALCTNACNKVECYEIVTWGRADVKTAQLNYAPNVQALHESNLKLHGKQTLP